MMDLEAVAALISFEFVKTNSSETSPEYHRRIVCKSSREKIVFSSFKDVRLHGMQLYFGP